ncbi:MAG TPA: sugar nucleotide-binding protein [Pirellulales bacterium]|nr:sugar nucleotide-binding protein [Pirellulales bacterium]
MDKLLVTCVEGLVGSNAAAMLAERCDVVGVSNVSGSAPYRVIACDPNDPLELAAIAEAESPRWLIHCGPLSRASWDSAGMLTPDAEHESHVAASLAAAARRCGARLAVILTDAVFAGPRLFHPETSTPTAGGPIAAAARAVEQALAETDALIVRTHAYGWSPRGAEPNYAERYWQLLSQGEACEVDAQRHATPILATDLAVLVHRALRARLHGLIHITGAERTSPFRFAAELALASNSAGRLVRLNDEPPRRPHADETSLNTHRVRRELETPLPLLREGLARFVEQADVFRQQLDTHAPALAA